MIFHIIFRIDDIIFYIEKIDCNNKSESGIFIVFDNNTNSKKISNILSQ